MPLPKRDRILLACLIGLALLRGVIYGAVIPPWQAPDEPGHFEYVRLLYQERRFISWSDRSPDLQQEIVASLEKFRFFKFVPWINEEQIQALGQFHQLPSYYLLNALALLFTNREDIAVQLYMMRFVSTLMGTAVVLLAYLSMRVLFPYNSFLQVGVPGFIIFLPMHTYVTSSVNNDHLAELMASFVIYLLTLSIKEGLSPAKTMAIGLSLLIGSYTKRTFFFIVPITLVALPVTLVLKRPMITWLGKLGAVACTTGILIGAVLLWQRGILTQWWSKIYHRLTYTSVSANPFAIFRELQELYPQYFAHIFKSFWGSFGWVVVELDPFLYGVVLVFCLASFAGLLLFGFRVVKRSIPLAAWQKAVMLVYLLAVLVLVLSIVLAFSMYEIDGSFGWWAKGHMPQGRYLFSAIIPIAAIFMFGLQELVPVKYHPQWLVICIGGFILLDSISLICYIIRFFYA